MNGTGKYLKYFFVLVAVLVTPVIFVVRHEYNGISKRHLGISFHHEPGTFMNSQSLEKVIEAQDNN